MQTFEQRQPVGTGQEAVRESAEPAAPVLDPPRPLRYTTSPLGPAPTLNGITAAENATVRHLTSGRVDLHGIGASVQRVPATDPRLRAVGARSLAQGTRALISDEADRGHEIWHLAQQALGAVRPTDRIGGHPVNTNPHLEAEADRMGALIGRHSQLSFMPPLSSPEAVGSGPKPIDISAPIQRQVTHFSATKGSYTPPIADLLNELDYSKFTDDDDDITDAITDNTWNPKKSNTDVPKEIKASISPNSLTQDGIARNNYKSGVVGKLGADMYFLYTGTWDTFEGGHLIPHELWSDADPQGSSADDYINLVPMSRNLNVGMSANNWRTQEKKMTDAVDKGNSFKVTVKVDRPVSNHFTYETIAERFGLHLKQKYAKDTVNIYNWLPNTIELTEDKSLFSFGQAYENQNFNVHDTIEDGAELISVLKQTPIWLRCSTALQKKLKKL